MRRFASVQFANALRVGAQVDVSDQPVTPPTTEADLERVFATVNGVNITSRDIEESLLPLIFNVQKRVYALRKQDVDLQINDLLLEQEAKRLGTTPRALIYQNVRTPIITDKEARAFYKENKATLPGDYDGSEGPNHAASARTGDCENRFRRTPSSCGRVRRSRYI